MPIVKTETVTCDRCGRGPWYETDNQWDQALYGWVTVELTHLSKGPLTGNDFQPPFVLCDKCRREKIPELIKRDGDE